MAWFRYEFSYFALLQNLLTPGVLHTVLYSEVFNRVARPELLVDILNSPAVRALVTPQTLDDITYSPVWKNNANPNVLRAIANTNAGKAALRNPKVRDLIEMAYEAATSVVD